MICKVQGAKNLTNNSLFIEQKKRRVDCRKCH